MKTDPWKLVMHACEEQQCVQTAVPMNIDSMFTKTFRFWLTAVYKLWLETAVVSKGGGDGARRIYSCQVQVPRRLQATREQPGHRRDTTTTTIHDREVQRWRRFPIKSHNETSIHNNVIDRRAELLFGSPRLNSSTTWCTMQVGMSVLWKEDIHERWC